MSYCGSTLLKTAMSRERASRVATVVNSSGAMKLAVNDLTGPDRLDRGRRHRGVWPRGPNFNSIVSRTPTWRLPLPRRLLQRRVRGPGWRRADHRQAQERTGRDGPPRLPGALPEVRRPGPRGSPCRAERRRGPADGRPRRGGLSWRENLRAAIASLPPRHLRRLRLDPRPRGRRPALRVPLADGRPGAACAGSTR